jgi:hypothetical protein
MDYCSPTGLIAPASKSFRFEYIGQPICGRVGRFTREKGKQSHFGHPQASAWRARSGTIRRGNDQSRDIAAMRRQVLKNEDFSSVTGGERLPKGAPSWIDAVLIARTIETWQPLYGSPLTPNDALEIILNVAALSEVLSKDNGL